MSLKSLACHAAIAQRRLGDDPLELPERYREASSSAAAPDITILSIREPRQC